MPRVTEIKTGYGMIIKENPNGTVSVSIEGGASMDFHKSGQDIVITTFNGSGYWMPTAVEGGPAMSIRPHPTNR